jgi:hypothetical protein
MSNAGYPQRKDAHAKTRLDAERRGTDCAARGHVGRSVVVEYESVTYATP